MPQEREQFVPEEVTRAEEPVGNEETPEARVTTEIEESQTHAFIEAARQSQEYERSESYQHIVELVATANALAYEADTTFAAQTIQDAEAKYNLHTTLAERLQRLGQYRAAHQEDLARTELADLETYMRNLVDTARQENLGTTQH